VSDPVWYVKPCGVAGDPPGIYTPKSGVATLVTYTKSLTTTTCDEIVISALAVALVGLMRLDLKPLWTMLVSMVTAAPFTLQ
jgi:hypothetical protein